MHWRLGVSGVLWLVLACTDAPTVARDAESVAREPGALQISGRITRNTIDPAGVLARNGRHVLVSGPISCDAGEHAELRATVTQRTTGAVAEGQGRLTCTGRDQRWELQLQTEGRATFDQGPAIVVALARTSSRGAVTDAHQWLVEVTLSRQR